MRLVRASRLRRLCGLSALLSCTPWLAQAATFKCLVDGKTTYQQSPCNAAAEAQGGAGQIKTTPSPSPGVTSFTAEEAARRKVKLADEGGPVAKDAFRLLVDGKVDAYVANLCPRERGLWSNPTMKSSLKYTGADMAKRKVTLGRVTDTGLFDLSFVGVENADGASDGKTAIKTVKVTATFEWNLGVICLRTMTVFDR